MKSLVRRGIAGSVFDVASMLAATRLLSGVPAMARAIRAEGATVSAAVAASAARFGTATALVDAAGTLTYRELDTAVTRLASSLRNTARVGISCDNTRTFVVALAAASRAGADAVFLGPRMGDLDRTAVAQRHGITHLLDDTERVAHFRPVSGEEEGRSGQVAKTRGARIIILSSGTTGAPKPTERAPLRLGQAMTAASLIAASGLRPRHPVLLLAPLNHGHGLSIAIASLTIGAPLVLPGGLGMDAALDLAERTGVRMISGVPAQLLRVAESFDVQPRDLRLTHVVSGSARLPAALTERLTHHFGPVVVDFFGSTATGTVTVAKARDLGTAGRPVAGVSIRIVDAAGAIVPRGVEGLVLASSPLSTSRASSRTGDRGFLDASGRLHLTGRADSIIVSGGENISASEAEDYLLAQPEITDAHVFAVPDERLDAVLAARVVLSSPLPTEQLLARITRDLGPAKTPRMLDVVDSIPRTATGKAQLKE